MAELRVQLARPEPRLLASTAFLGERLGLRIRVVTAGAVEKPHLVVGEAPDTLPSALVIPTGDGTVVWSELLDGRFHPATFAGSVVPFDVVGAIDRLLTDAVHAGHDPAALDGHGRLRFADSAPARCGVGDQPLVDRYVLVLGELLERRFGLVGDPAWPAGKRAAIALSHDVDQPDRYALLRSAVRPWRFRRHPRSYAVGAWRLARARLRDADPHDSWVWKQVAESEARHGFRSTFFVAATPFHHARGADVDVAYDVAERRFRPILRSLAAGGFEVGLHTGYRAHEHDDWLRDERDRLADAAGVEIDGSRHHFWHLGPDVEATLRAHERAGFAHDSSLAFNDHVGFRRSVAFPFRPWDEQLGRPLRTIQVPTAVMDGNLLYGSADVDAAVAEVGRVVETIRSVGGVGSIDWHIQASVPRTPEYRHWGVAYQEILGLLASEPDLWVTSHREIARWSAARSAVLRAGEAGTTDTVPASPVADAGADAPTGALARAG
jgi:hypothetical protein